jgi:hypothetical protein
VDAEHAPERRRDRDLQKLLDREALLESRITEEDLRHSGLKDLDAILELIAVKLEIDNHLLAHYDPNTPDTTVGSAGAVELGERAAAAVGILEELRGLNISEDQKDQITGAPGYGRIKEQFEAFILRGGGVFLEQLRDPGKIKAVSRALNEALRKFAVPDDRYAQVFKTEALPEFLRRIVNFFLPTLAPEGQAEPPYGIEEGEEVLLSSERMRMPLSQGIHYLETLVLPQLREALRKNPGSRSIQERIAQVDERLREYKSVTLRSRATPINLEQGFYTEWLSQYTADGELLVSVPIEVFYGSGTNLDRFREMVRTEFVRRLAGRGICPALDEDYRFRKSLASGRRGSSRLPSLKVDVQRAYREIKRMVPGVGLLDDNRTLRNLLTIVTKNRRRGSQRAIEHMMRRESKNDPRVS